MDAKPKATPRSSVVFNISESTWCGNCNHVIRRDFVGQPGETDWYHPTDENPFDGFVECES